jgi:hypothetical protein
MHQMHHPESTSLRCLRWFLQTKVHQSQAWLDLCIKHMSLTHLWQLTGNGWTVLTVILHARVSVCVWTICTDVKLPFVWLMVWFVSSRFWTMFAGGHRRPIELCPTKLSMVSLGYPGWSPGRTCTRFETFDCHGTWLTQEPPSRFSVASGPSLELCSKWFQTIVRFSQSELLPISSDGTVTFCKDKERILLHWFSCPVIQFLLSDFRGLFVHARCIPHQ